MNKKLKIATAAVSVVMAGTMAFGMFGCGGGGGGGKKPAGNKQEKYTVAAADADLSGVTLNVNIGDKVQRSISYKNSGLLSGTIQLPDGKSYNSSALKPAWKAFSEEIGVGLNDVWQNEKNKLTTAINSATSGNQLADMDIISDGCANISDNASKLLDLSNYLDEMPNYAAFLAANDSVRLSLTSNTTTGAMYAAPYFDGNNDIEKYQLCKTNWVKALLDNTTGGDTTTTYKSHGEAKKDRGATSDWGATLTTSTAIEAFMGTTGSYTTDVLLNDGTAGKITVNYTKAATSAKSGTIASVLSTAGIAAYTGDSGNIVDIMNHAINTKQGEVTGDTLLKILQEYIKVAYYAGEESSTTAFYTQSGYNLSDVFVGKAAAWDVDLYAALGRVLVTNPALLKSGKNASGHVGDGKTGEDYTTPLKDLFLLSARKNDMQRQSDTIALVGQLYGIRGLESKNLYTYIGKDGQVHDPRGEADSYAAMIKFNAFWQEGLVYTGSTAKDADQSWAKSNTPEALTTYDYVNTQTPTGFQVSGDVTNTYSLEADYYYTPIITPVSKWDENGNGSIAADEYFRFTESWRTTKDSGFCIPVDNVKSNPNKLRAVLKFIDTMFSHDGQILLTYGPKATSANASDGFWFNAPATETEISEGKYFTFKGQKLQGVGDKYAGEYQPTVLTATRNAYLGKQVNGQYYDGKSGIQYAGGDTVVAVPNNTTDKYAKTDKWKHTADVWAVKKDGTFEKITAGTEIASGTFYIVEGTVAANTEATGAAYYFVDKDGKLTDKTAKRIPLQKDDVNQWIQGCARSYTDFARYVIGAALVVGNKLQSFEFQMTSDMGRDGAQIVDAALTAGVIRHTVNSMTNQWGNNPWYTVVPTVLPYTTTETNALTSTHKNLYKNGEDYAYFSNSSKLDNSLYFQLIRYGYDTSKIKGTGSLYTGLGLASGTTSASDIMNRLASVDGYVAYLNIKKAAWNRSKAYFETLNAAD